MATFNQTLSSSINFSGPQAATKWGASMVWGTDRWAYDSHTTGNFFLPVSVNSKHNDSGPTLLDSSSNQFRPATFVNTMAFGQGSGQSEFLKSANGYFYALAGGAKNNENAFVPIYTAQAAAATAWATSASAPASWVVSP